VTTADALRLLRPLVNDVGTAVDVAALMGSSAASFPPAHLDLLQHLNGMTVFHGAFRLFGLRPEPFLDLSEWNAREAWRFAWDDRVDPYLIFGETAWGDQYAYRHVARQELAPEVHFLEGTLLRSEVIAASFEEFLFNEFIRNAQQPYDVFTVEAVQRRGSVAAGNHWVFAPPIALGGSELIEDVTEIPAVTAMTFAGDIASALRASPAGTSPVHVTPWTDDRGRSRLRVAFV
jgi:hypothetical protein